MLSVREGASSVLCQGYDSFIFAAGHQSYARLGWYYLETMLRLPADVASNFLKGFHSVRLSDGVWNGMWADWLIESTFMRK